MDIQTRAPTRLRRMKMGSFLALTIHAIFHSAVWDHKIVCRKKVYQEELFNGKYTISKRRMKV